MRETGVRWRPYEIELSGPCDGNPFVDVTLRAEFRHGDRTLTVSGFYDLEERTLRTLAESPFNKLRMCVFPKSFLYNTNEPQRYPFADVGDFRRPDPVFFSHLERRIGELARLGIEADLILFHPYDRWGFADMGAEADERYVRYVVARLAAFPNVWWSLANEFDLMPAKSIADWDRLGEIVRSSDPHAHLLGMHNCFEFWDHNSDWVTHASLRGESPARIAFLRTVLEDVPGAGIDLLPGMRDVPIGGVEGAYYLAYFGFMQPRRRTFVLSPDIRFRVDVLDTWQLTVTPVPGTFAGTFPVDLPGRPFIAVRLRAVD